MLQGGWESCKNQSDDVIFFRYGGQSLHRSSCSSSPIVKQGKVGKCVVENLLFRRKMEAELDYRDGFWMRVVHPN